MTTLRAHSQIASRTEQLERGCPARFARTQSASVLLTHLMAMLYFTVGKLRLPQF